MLKKVDGNYTGKASTVIQKLVVLSKIGTAFTIGIGLKIVVSLNLSDIYFGIRACILVDKNCVLFVLHGFSLNECHIL